MNRKDRMQVQSQQLPPELAEVALVDGHISAAAGGVSASWWRDAVRAGRAPAPVIRRHRCTRWRLADVRDFWAKMAERGAADVQSAAELKARATKASAAAKAKRAAPATAAAK